MSEQDFTINYGIFSDEGYKMMRTIIDRYPAWRSESKFMAFKTHNLLSQDITGEVVSHIHLHEIFLCKKDIKKLSTFTAKDFAKAIYVTYCSICNHETDDIIGDWNKAVDRTISVTARGTSMEIYKFNIRKYRLLYDVLKGVKISVIKKTYSNDLINEVVGHLRNPFEVEKMKTFLEEVKKLDEQLDTDKVLIYKKYEDEYNKMREVLAKRQSNEMDGVLIKYNEDVKKLKESLGLV